jgi:bla regulator protein BlaR1
MKSILFNPHGWSEGLLSGMLLSLVVGLLGISVLYLAQRVWPSKSAATRFWVVFSILCVVLVSFVGVFLYAVLRSPYLSTSNQPLAYLMTLWSVETPVWSWQQLWIDVLIWSYFVGLILQMCLLFRSYVSIQLLKGRPVVEVPEAWNELMIQTKETLGIGRNIRFALSQFVPTPMLMGYFKPVILFPFASVNQLDLEQVEAILIHELSHILRQDYVWNWVIAMIQAVLFFNPFVWILVQLLEEERECACDDQVVRIQGRPLNYAQTLLQLSQLSQSQMAPVGVLQAGGNHKSQLFNRILRITDMNQMNKKITFMQQRFLLLALALTSGLLLSSFKQMSEFHETMASKVENPVKFQQPPMMLSATSTKMETAKKQLALRDEVADTFKTQLRYKGNPNARISKPNDGLIVKSEIPQRLPSEYTLTVIMAELFANNNLIDSARKAFYNSSQWQIELEKFNLPIEPYITDSIFQELQAQVAPYLELKKLAEQSRILTENLRERMASQSIKLEEMLKKGVVTSEDFAIQSKDFAERINSRLEQEEGLTKLYQSKEYKELQQDFLNKVERLKKKQLKEKK